MLAERTAPVLRVRVPSDSNELTDSDPDFNMHEASDAPSSDGGSESESHGDSDETTEGKGGASSSGEEGIFGVGRRRTPKRQKRAASPSARAGRGSQSLGKRGGKRGAGLGVGITAASLDSAPPHANDDDSPDLPPPPLPLPPPGGVYVFEGQSVRVPDAWPTEPRTGTEMLCPELRAVIVSVLHPSTTVVQQSGECTLCALTLPRWLTLHASNTPCTLDAHSMQRSTAA